MLALSFTLYSTSLWYSSDFVQHLVTLTFPSNLKTLPSSKGDSAFCSLTSWFSYFSKAIDL